METTSKGQLWTGRVLTVLAALPFIISSAVKFAKGTPVLEGFQHLGWPE